MSFIYFKKGTRPEQTNPMLLKGEFISSSGTKEFLQDPDSVIERAVGRPVRTRRSGRAPQIPRTDTRNMSPR